MSNAPTVGHALFALGGTKGTLNLTGIVEDGTFDPAIQLDATATGSPSWASLAARYLGARPAAEGSAEAGFGSGEATGLQFLDDLVADAQNSLGIDPAAVTAIRVDITKKNNGTAYYDLNCVLMPGDLLADKWIEIIHGKRFPTATADAAKASDAAGQAHQAQLLTWWRANPDQPRPDGLATDPQVLELWGPRFQVSIPHAGQSGRGAPHPLNEMAGWFSFDQNGPELPQVFVSVLDASTSGGKPKWWVSYGGATDQAFTLRVVDLTTGLAKEYAHAQGQLLGVVDVGTFG